MAIVVSSVEVKLVGVVVVVVVVAEVVGFAVGKLVLLNNSLVVGIVVGVGAVTLTLFMSVTERPM